MSGRPQNKFFKLLSFRLSKLNGRHVAICNICSKTLKNTAAARLKGHRNICKNEQSVEFSIDNQRITDELESMDEIEKPNDKLNKNNEERKWISVDTEELINEIFMRRPLWDSNSSEYNKRDVIRKLWNDVAETLKCDKEYLKNRWKNLRDNYRIELKKHNKNLKLGSAAETKTIKWSHFDSLDFLRNIYEKNMLDDDLTSDFTSVMNNDNIPEADYTRKIEELKLEKRTPLPKTSKVITKRKRLDVEKQKEHVKLLKSESEITNDSDYYFLISCLPHLRNLSQLNNLKFRNETIKLLIDLKQAEEAASNANQVFYEIT